MKLVSNWKHAWTWFSVHVLAAIGIVNAVAAALPPTPTTSAIIAGSSAAAAVVGIIGRVVDQGAPAQSAPQT